MAALTDRINQMETHLKNLQSYYGAISAQEIDEVLKKQNATETLACMTDEEIRAILAARKS